MTEQETRDAPSEIRREGNLQIFINHYEKMKTVRDGKIHLFTDLFPFYEN